jgi:hypothetical protein
MMPRGSDGSFMKRVSIVIGSVIRTFAVAVLLMTMVNVNLAESQTIARDGISTDTLQRFDRSRAIPDPSLRITSLQNDAVIPNNYRYPVIEWAKPDREMETFLLQLRSAARQLDVMVTKNRWQPEGGEFEPFLKDREVSMTLFGLRQDKTYVGPSLRIIIAGIPLSDRIAYRMVQPLFNAALPNAIRIFSLDTREPDTLMALEKTCVGCHAYSPHAALFNIKKGNDRKLVTVTEEKGKLQPNHQTHGEFSFLSTARSGRYALLVLNAQGKLKTNRSVYEPFELPYRSGDVYYLDIEKGVLAPLNGASTPDFVEDMPFFSPDGKQVIFTRYRFNEPDGERPIPSMSLYKVAFNDGKGGEPVPIPVAASAMPFQYFPRYSPDGKWISFCSGQADRGVFARKTSDIYLLSVDGDKPVRMNLNLDNVMDSWHDWSSDSRWLLFASNREPNGMTALYLVYVDEKGRDYPPVKLAGYENMKVNTPQFIAEGFDLKAAKGMKEYVDSAFREKRP